MAMENKEIVTLLEETADLMEIAGQDSFRIRSYRNAARAIENLTERVVDILADPERKLTDIPYIGQGMAAHVEQICHEGKLSTREQLAAKIPAVALEMLKIQGLGPKSVGTVLAHFKIKSLDELESLASEGRLRDLPRMGEKLELKIIKSIEAHKQTAGRFLIGTADEQARELCAYLAYCPGIQKITPAGSLRRGAETIGDLDLLVTGGEPEAITKRLLEFPKMADVLAKGPNKVSIKLKQGLQVDVRMLEPESYGAALQYFTGSKAHNVVLRDRAKRMGYKLNEHGLFSVEDEKLVAARTEQDIYKNLGLAFIEPEMRENLGEIDAAEADELPDLVQLKDILGDLHMHTTATDGKCSIREMARAAQERGYKYVAITDHSKALAMANGMNEKRVLEQIQEIRKAEKEFENFRIFAGTEVDIHQNGMLDMDDEVLAQLDAVVASVHSHMNLPAEQMTERLLRAFENPYLRILGHPTGRLVLRREPFTFYMEAILKEARRRNIAMEINSFPDRLDLKDHHVRLAKQHGVKIVISTDSHHTKHLSHMKYGVLVARRAWLTKKDVLNTLPPEKFLEVLKRKD